MLVRTLKGRKLLNLKNTLSENQRILHYKNKILFPLYLLVTSSLLLFYLFTEMEIPLVLGFISMLVFSYTIGFAIFIPLNLSQIHFFPKLVLYLGAGFLISFVWTYFLSPFTVQPVSYFSLYITSVIVIFYYLHKKNNFERTTNLDNKNKAWTPSELFKAQDKPHFNKSNIVLLSTLVIIFTYLILQINHQGWPPGGDIEGHAYYTTLQIFNDKLLTHTPHFPNEVITYPLGMHFLAANLSILYNISPPQIFLIFGGVLLFLISITLLAIVYVVTKSSWLAVITLFVSLHVHASSNLETYLWGYFFNGPIPNLGAFFLFFFLILFFLVNKSSRISSVLSTSILFMVSGMVIYPPSIIYSTLVIFPFIFSSHYFNKMKNFQRTNWNKIFPRILKFNLKNFFIVIIILGLVSGPLVQHVFEVVSFQSQGENLGHAIHYANIERYFVDDIFSISFVAGLIVSTYLIIRHQDARPIGYIVLVFFLMGIIGSYIPSLYVFIAPGRFFSLIPILSWMILSLLIYQGWEHMKNNNNQKKFGNRYKPKRKRVFQQSKKYVIISIFGIITLLLMIPDVARGNYFTFQEELNYYRNVEQDKSAFDWIYKNVGSNELILDVAKFSGDRSYKWLQGIEYKRTVNGRYWEYGLTSDENKEINNAFSLAHNEFQLGFTLKKYNVSYIITSSFDKFGQVSNEYNFLKIVFRDRINTIYNVDLKSILSQKKIEEVMVIDMLYHAQKQEIAGDIAFAHGMYSDVIPLLIVLNLENGNDLTLIKIDEGGKYFMIVKISDQILETREKVFALEKKVDLEGDVNFRIKIYNQAVDKRPDDFEAWAKLILNSKVKYEYPEINKIFQKMANNFQTLRDLSDTSEERIKFSNFYVKTLQGLVLFQEESSKYPQAIITYDKLLGEDQFNLEVLKRKAGLLFEMEEYILTRDTYQKILSLEPENLEIKQKLDKLEPFR